MNNIEILIKSAGLLSEKLKEYTLIVDDKGQEHGMLFFFKINGRQYKIMLPTPHHMVWKDERPTYQQLLKNKEAMLLK
ncbi:hypothetical protein ORI89_05085 [Sphingobacterium sp. UT-1RO-CII-1]|uniref:hypothetical protein n=1 Tax=Sphingobacterium sp. UT-1RO-CII-1 TaxID=2995225 RepID=UPI00227B8618|nr:hypothetical protein [Sphingobacterium sp. UT-1RO-CII-1]MCY4779013.1 hypothetical protein [Sphingobacterium sp. UT-1RO-CII-1]